MEWGPWIEHDGKGCPCVGMYVQAEYNANVRNWIGCGSAIVSGKKVECIVVSQDPSRSSWFHSRGFNPVIRYRIRKPRGMTVLKEIVMNPERVLEEV